MKKYFFVLAACVLTAALFACYGTPHGPAGGLSEGSVTFSDDGGGSFQISETGETGGAGESGVSETPSEETSEEASEKTPKEDSGETSEEIPEAPEITRFAVEAGGQILEWEILSHPQKDGAFDGVLSLELPYTFDVSLLKSVCPEIDAGGAATVNQAENGLVDLTAGFGCLFSGGAASFVTVTVTGENGAARDYAVQTGYRVLGLPVMSISVDGGAEIVSKEIDLPCIISLECGHCGGEWAGVPPSRGIVHGRGHYSWQFDKKSFTVKFDEKQNVLGLGKAKKWVLTANYTDKSLLQNYLALEMAKALPGLRFSVTQYPVDLFVNGVYRGVYTLGEKIEVKKRRIELDTEEAEDMAFLIEIGGAEEGGVAGTDYFSTGLLKAFTINYPKERDITESEREYILDYLTKADEAVRSLSGYEAYIDVDSLIDWTILYEFTANIDGVFRRSGYLYKDAGGKLCMGPAWDFDLAFGNFLKYEADTFACLGSDDGYAPYNWMNILYEDQLFCQRLKTRWDEVKEDLYTETVHKLDSMAAALAPSAALNFEVWDILDTRVLSNPRNWYEWRTWEAHVQRLRDYLALRYRWLDANF